MCIRDRDAYARLKQGLDAVVRGPRAARAQRHTMLRKVVLDHRGHTYHGTIRNISVTGAMIEGIWDVPVGTVFNVQLSRDFSVSCTVRWSSEDRMGVEFASPLQRDRDGRIMAVLSPAPIRTIDQTVSVSQSDAA
ncbi:MAG: PilZ domain-containing protein, partial [Alteraurantiacibacter sp.]|nr:PilZ domain-containing protein [Alteraurantiacibacter sp.]